MPALREIQNHLLRCTMPFAIGFVSERPEENPMSYKKFLAYSETSDEFLSRILTLFSAVQSMSVYIDMNMMQPSKVLRLNPICVERSHKRKRLRGKEQVGFDPDTHTHLHNNAKHSAEDREKQLAKRMHLDATRLAALSPKVWQNVAGRWP